MRIIRLSLILVHVHIEQIHCLLLLLRHKLQVIVVWIIRLHAGHAGGEARVRVDARPRIRLLLLELWLRGILTSTEALVRPKVLEIGRLLHQHLVLHH